MGIINPRPAMRGREERNMRRNLEAHAARMKELIAGGMNAEAASKQALTDILGPLKPKTEYTPCVCTSCGWLGVRVPKGLKKPCPKCGADVVRA